MLGAVVAVIVFCFLLMLGTIGGAAAAGADVFISGSWLYSFPAGKSAAVQLLRDQARAAMGSFPVAAGGGAA